MKPFLKISLYLNSKYNIKNTILKNNIINENEEEKLNKKKIITINFVGSLNKIYENIFRKKILEGLNENFIFEINSENPDYLIYDVFNCRFLEKKHKNSIKIAIYTENQIPDFNEADYAIGFHNIIFLDRYFKKTTLIWVFEKRYLNIKNKDFISKRKQVLKGNIRKKFCAAVISNIRSSDKFRIKFIKELNNYKKIDMGGKFLNNVGGRVKNKIKFLSSYKFSIAMENSEGQGYVSEKILDSFMAGTIPIYYGGYMIDEYINPKSLF